MRFLTVIALLAILPVPAFGETTFVRDRSGTIIEKRITEGDAVRVYDRHGKLLRVEKTRGDGWRSVTAPEDCLNGGGPRMS